MSDPQPADDRATLKRAAYQIRASQARGTAHIPDDMTAMTDAELSALWQTTAENDSLLDPLFDELQARGRDDLCRSDDTHDGTTRLYVFFRSKIDQPREERTDVTDTTAREIAMHDASVTVVRVHEKTPDGVFSTRDVWPPSGEWARATAARLSELDAENVVLREAVGIGQFCRVLPLLEREPKEDPLSWQSAPDRDGLWLRLAPSSPTQTPVVVCFDEASGRVSLPALSLGFLKHEPGCVYLGPIALPRQKGKNDSARKRHAARTLWRRHLYRVLAQRHRGATADDARLWHLSQLAAVPAVATGAAEAKAHAAAAHARARAAA